VTSVTLKFRTATDRSRPPTSAAPALLVKRTSDPYTRVPGKSCVSFMPVAEFGCRSLEHLSCCMGTRAPHECYASDAPAGKLLHRDLTVRQRRGESRHSGSRMPYAFQPPSRSSEMSRCSPVNITACAASAQGKK